MLRSCIKEGCFPDVVLKRVDPFKFFSEYLDLVIYKDIIVRYGVKNRVALEFFFKNAIASNSSIFSINKIYNVAKSMQIKASKNSFYNFQEFLKDVNVIFSLKKYSRSMRERELSLTKTFVFDNRIYTFATYKFDFGNLLESFVFQELLKAGHEANKNIYYFRNSYEVDFALLEGESVKQLIQVTYVSRKDEVDKREIMGLIKASEILKCKNLVVITWDLEDELVFKNKKIQFIPLWKWLLK